jgi:(R,R)-butanediol dehydrogenase/meso-butanediol dehydrogenase/diacetyl reductase
VQAGLHVGNATVDPMKWSLKDIRIEGTWCYPVTIWPRIIGMIANGKFPVEKLIHDLIDADDVVAKGFDVLSDNGSDKMKILINPQTR